MKRWLTRGVIALIAVALVVIPIFILTQPLQRRIPFRVSGKPAPVPPGERLGSLAPERWTARIVLLENSGRLSRLDEELTELRRLQPEVFAKQDLSYLHARVKQELGEHDEAAALYRVYAAPERRFADLALYHLSEIAVEEDDPGEASRLREELIDQYPASVSWSQAVDDQVAYLAERGDLDRFAAFAGKLRPKASTALRRQLDAMVVEMLVSREALAEARQRGFRLLQGGKDDDAAERVFRALDRSEVVNSVNAEELLLLGETAQAHRRFERAVALLTAARNGLPAKQDEIVFAIGRSYFGNEQYAEAEKTYLQGAAGAKRPDAKATLLYHASRAAQLLGDDSRAEAQMTRAIAVPGQFPSTSAALTQRMRTRAAAGRMAEASSDLQLLKRLFPNRYAVVEASISLATFRIAGGAAAVALADLAAIPSASLEPYDRPEINYWEARALEASDPKAALANYLQVLRADVPAHHAFFARERLAGGFKTEAAAEAERLRGEAQNASAAGDLERARRMQTDVVLLAPDSRDDLDRLREIYKKVPAYAEILDLKPESFPALPVAENASRAERLFALGLFEELGDEIGSRYPLRSRQSMLTAAYAHHLAGSSRLSMQAIEVLARNVPDDFIPELLPPLIQELLYPRYYYEQILEEARSHDADPDLVLAIMREESRFNPRAKSVAAARGLLQFILTTAMQIGRDIGIAELSPEDLYDPVIIIELGAKYIGDLMKEFEGNRYRAAAAYNAGPYQTRLWSRLSPGPGHDFFFSAINFEETRHYVRKVMNSYHRYLEIYAHSGSGGGTRAEP